MTILDWDFYYYPPTGGSPVLLQNVQGFSCEQGREGIQEPFRSSTGSVSGRVPSALPTIEVNGVIQAFTVTNGFFASFSITNFVINYGIVQSEDSWTITLEDALAQAGRATTTVSWAAGTTTRNAADLACLAAGLSLDFTLTDVPKQTVSAQSIVNESLLTVLQQLVSTEQAQITGAGFGQIFWTSQGWPDTPIGVFTDGSVGSPTSSDIKYDEVQFAGIADNYFTKVIVTPEGGAAQSAGSTGRTLDVATYSQTNNDALQAANYILAQVNVDTQIPFMISALWNRQTNNMLLTRGPGSLTTVILRGTTYQVYVLSRQVSATPGQTRFSFGVTDALAIGYFILNNQYFGVLNQNKLGW